MEKRPLSDFYNLMSMSNAVVWGSWNGGPAFRIRPGSDKDRATAPDTPLWHYMPLPYFLDLLATKSLFFTRLTHHHESDEFEGALPLAAAQMLENIVADRGGDVEEFRQARHTVVKKFLRVVLVNCWMEHARESRQMWDRYGKFKEAVAVLATFGSLRDSLPQNVDVGHVEYVDYAQEQFLGFSVNPSFQAFYKRREYEDEREVRAMIFDWPPISPKFDEPIPIEAGTAIGYHFPVDLSVLLRGVVVSPDTPSIIDQVRGAVATAGLHIDVEPSTLNRPPMF